MAVLAALPDARSAALAADRLPTLTEVVEFGLSAPAAAAGGEIAASALASVRLGTAAAPPGTPEICSTVLAELRPRIEMLLEARLREAVAPALARAADELIRDTREQLADTLQGLVQALVQEALAKALEQRQSG